MVKNFLQCRWSRFNSWIEKISWRRKWQPTSVFFPRKSRRGAGGPQSTGSQRVGHNVVTEQQDSLVPGEPHILPRTLVVTSVPGRSWPASYSSPFYGCGFQNPVSESVLESCFHRLVINYYFIIFWQRIKLLQPSEIYPFSQLRHVSMEIRTQRCPELPISGFGVPMCGNIHLPQIVWGVDLAFACDIKTWHDCEITSDYNLLSSSCHTFGKTEYLRGFKVVQWPLCSIVKTKFRRLKLLWHVLCLSNNLRNSF